MSEDRIKKSDITVSCDNSLTCENRYRVWYQRRGEMSQVVARSSHRTHAIVMANHLYELGSLERFVNEDIDWYDEFAARYDR